jgi:hypothetical protein
MVEKAFTIDCRKPPFKSANHSPRTLRALWSKSSPELPLLFICSSLPTACYVGGIRSSARASSAAVTLPYMTPTPERHIKQISHKTRS